MKRFLLALAVLLVLLAVGSPAYSQGARFDDTAFKYTSGGVWPAANATVTVCSSVSGIPCTTPVTVYTDAALSVPCTVATVGCLLTDGKGNYSFFATAATTYIITITGTGLTGYQKTWVAPIVGGGAGSFTTITASGLASLNGGFALPLGQTGTVNGALSGSGSISIGSFNGVCYIDGIKYTTLLAAFGDAGCSTIDDTGFKSGGTIASTITWPSRPIQLKLAAGVTYAGPASGAMFLINTNLANGSSITGGAGITANQQSNYGNGTVLKNNASNTSPPIQILSGAAAQTLQGYRLENLVLDGNSSATDLLLLDAVRNSKFFNLSFNNCTGWMIHFTVTNTGSNQGNQFNEFDGVYGGSCNAVMMLDGNTPFTSTTTLNEFRHIAVNFSCASCAGIEIKEGDGNRFEDIEALNPTHSPFTGQCTQADAPNGATTEGGIFNYFVGYHVNCAQGSTGGDTFRAKAGSLGNHILQFNAIENQTAPVIEATAQLDYDIYRANTTGYWLLNQFKDVAWHTATGTIDVSIGRCAANQLKLNSVPNSCNGLGQLIMNYGQSAFWDTTAAGVFQQNGTTVIDGSRVGHLSGLSLIGGAALPLISATAPTIAAGGCGGSAAAISAPNGTASFNIFTGTAPTSGGCTITMPAATTDWHCEANHVSAISTTNFIIQQTGALSTTSVTLQLFSDVAAATAPTASDTWRTTCTAN